MVTVKLISSVDLWKALTMTGIAGRYMLAVKGLNKPANEMMATRNHFSRREYTLYGAWSSACGGALLVFPPDVDIAVTGKERVSAHPI